MFAAMIRHMTVEAAAIQAHNNQVETAMRNASRGRG
jgi:hypothetical protein